MNFCPVCHRVVGIATTCSVCIKDLYTMLSTIRTLVPELNTELMMKSHKTNNVNPNGRSSTTPLPFSPDASELIDYGYEILRDWLTRSGMRLDVPGLTLVQLADTALHQFRRLARVVGVHMMFQELANFRDALVKMVDLPAEQVFLGFCVACGASMHGDGASEYQVCPCGSQMVTQEAKTAVREEIEQSWLTPKETREYLKARGASVSSQTLSNWGYQEKVTRKEYEGSNYYLLSSVTSYAYERGILTSKG